jgi:CRP/FNR family transcriptional regulator
LHGVSQDAVATIGRSAVRRLFRGGEIIALEGEPARAAGIIESGQVRVYRTSPSGREQVLGVLGPGSVYNLAPMFQPGGVCLSSVQALTDGWLLAIQRDALVAAIRQSPDLGLALLRHLADRLEGLADLAEDLSLRTVRARLARFLLRGATGDGVARRWTQDEMASQIGTVRDVVGRSLRSFENEGLIQIDRHRIVLTDRPGLEAAAEL